MPLCKIIIHYLMPTRCALIPDKAIKNRTSCSGSEPGKPFLPSEGAPVTKVLAAVFLSQRAALLVQPVAFAYSKTKRGK